MLSKVDARSIISAGFRHLWAFLLVFVPILLAGVLYILLAPALYQSNAKILLKFGQDARPEISADPKTENLSAEEKRGLVQSNLNILASRDLGEAVLLKTGVRAVYPDLKTDTPDKQMEIALKNFSDDLSAKTESEAGIIHIGFFNKDPVVAAETLRVLIDLFIERQSEIYGNPHTEFLRTQALNAKNRLEEANQNLANYKMQHGIASLDEELTILLQQRGDLVGYLSRRKTGEAGGTQEKLEALPARIAKSGDTARFPVVEDIQKNINDLETRESALLLTYKPNSDLIKNIRKNIEEEKKSLDQSLAALNTQIEDLDRQITEKQDLRAAHDDFVRQVALAEESYKLAQSRLQAAETNSDLNQQKIARLSIIEEPTVPYKSSKPNKPVILALSLILATAFGGAFVLGREIFRSTFSNPEQMQSDLKIPSIATFAHATLNGTDLLRPSYQYRRIKSFISGQDVSNLLPGNTAVELNRNDLMALYHAIEKALPDKACRIVQIAGGYGGEGVTTISHELAQIACKKLGQKVLCIDSSDPNSPSSLIETIKEGKNIKDILHPPSGSIRFSRLALSTDQKFDIFLANPEKFREIIETLRHDFSLIILSTPAIAANNSAIKLGHFTDGAIFVVEAERTRAPAARQSLKLMKGSNDNILGLILNKRLHYIPDWVYRRL